VSLFVDTSVWSLALRRDAVDPDRSPYVAALGAAIRSGEPIFTTGLVLQEILQGFRGPRQRDRILERFAALPLLVPDRTDHIEAAEIRNRCRRRGIQIGTIDALLTALCIRHELALLTSDADFARVADREPLLLWSR
jgi:predicted nucleic acid-binding protein